MNEWVDRICQDFILQDITYTAERVKRGWEPFEGTLC
jgi:hypothetical protein